jgi:outer membrane protein OmpA-like peptidoglycan-associated protein
MIKNRIIFIKASAFMALAFFISLSSYAQDADLNRVFSLNYDEQKPLLASDGTLFFTLAFHPENLGGKEDAGDVWSASREEGGFKSPGPVEGLSTPFYDVLIGFIHQDTALVYHANLDNRQVVCRYFKEGLRWNKDTVQQIPGLKTKGEYFSAVLDGSGTIMVLAMDSFGSYGNEDLYFSKRKGNSWTRPVNLGTGINTGWQELSPAISPEADTIYFSSNAYKGDKNMEVYVSYKLNDSWKNWSKPKPINPSEMDGIDTYFFLETENDRYFFTNTQTSEGYGNIYVSGGNIAVGGKIPDVKTEKYFRESDLTQLNSSGFLSREEKTAPDGKITVTGEKNNEGKESSGLSKELTGLGINEALVLKDILFIRGSVKLVDQERLQWLDELYGYLMKHPKTVLSIEGHTDSYGNPSLNERLSLARAKKVKELLVKKGISGERLSTKGWGGKKPVATNSNEEGRRKNRRVEVIVLAKE